MSVTAVDKTVGEFDAFVRARTGPLLRAAYVLTGDQHLAEDLVQSALARTYRAWDRLHAAGSADAYTRKTMYHLQVSWWRRRRVAEVFPGELPAVPGGADPAESSATRLLLRSVLLRLPPRQRAVLVLRFFDDLTEQQTAQTLGVTVGTVKSQTAKALAKLRVLAPELREFYGDAATEVKAVDLRARAVASSRRLSAQRTAAAAVVVLATALAAVLTLLGRPDGPPPLTPSPAPSATQLPGPAPAETADLGPFHDTEITVPPWSAPGSGCPSGRLRLDGNGQHVGATRQVWVGRHVRADVDGTGGEELVAVVACGEGPESPGTEVLAFRQDASGALVTVGRVVGTRDGFGRIYGIEAAPDGVVVEVSKEYTDGMQGDVPFQRRTYRLVGGAFRQVAGPTSFPARPASAALRLRTSDLVVEPAAEGRFTGRLTVTVANTGAVDVARVRLTLRVLPWLRPAGPVWGGCSAEAFDDPVGTALTCPIDGPRAGSEVAIEFTFVAESLPADLNPRPEFEWQPPYQAQVEQLPPYVFAAPGMAEQAFTVVRR